MNFAKIAEIASFRGHDMIVQFGNPQVEMLFDRGPGGALVAKIDGSGIVESAERADGGEGDGGEPEMELDFGSDEQGGEGGEPAPEDEQQEEDGTQEPEDGDEPGADVSKEEIEEFILSVKPTFPDIPFDFPAIIAMRQETNERWMDTARSLKVSTGKLHASLSAYKKRVKKMIIEQRDDNGAA